MQNEIHVYTLYIKILLPVRPFKIYSMSFIILTFNIEKMAYRFTQSTAYI